MASRSEDLPLVIKANVISLNGRNQCILLAAIMKLSQGSYETKSQGLSLSQETIVSFSYYLPGILYVTALILSLCTEVYIFTSNSSMMLFGFTNLPNG